MKQAHAEQEQLTLAEARLTSNDPNRQVAALSSSIGGYEKLDAQIKFAQKYYDDASEELQKARLNADRQMSYLAVFVRPALAETPLYPKRLQDVLIVFLVSSGGWLLLLLAYQSIREHA